MNKDQRFIILGAGLIITAVLYFTALNYQKSFTPVWRPADFFSSFEQMDHHIGYEIIIKDEQGNIVSKASRTVSAGDEIINSDGVHYKVVKVRGDQAQAKNIGVDQQYLAYRDFFSDYAVPAATSSGSGQKTVAIYHTHSDESYVPTDGTESIPFKGGIYQVGQSLSHKLKKENIGVLYDRTPHDPHDNNAYYRSRRTAAALMKEKPVAILDVHRDGIPDASYYRKNISGDQVAQVRLVIGRQNPKKSSNLDFAKRLMAYANKEHPRIVKEIFMANGNYNQDLMSTALLLEAGTHTNTKQEAENGVALLAGAIPTVLGAPSSIPGAGGGGAATGGAWKALAWVLGLTVVLGGAFLIVSSGGLNQAKDRLRTLVSSEFAGFFGPLRKIGSKRKRGGD